MTEKMNNLENYIIVCCPEIQEYMDKEGLIRTFLIIDEHLADLYGSSAYFVSKTWINKCSKI